MAKITKLPSGNWRTLVYMGKDENGKNVSVSITAPTKDEVIVKMGELKKQKKLRKNGSMTVRDAVKKYIELSSPIIAASTAARYEKMLEYAFPHFMDYQLKDLTEEICQDAINMEQLRCGVKSHKPLAAKTIHNEWGLISSALSNQDYHFNIKLPRITRKLDDLPEPQEVIDTFVGTKIELPCMLAIWCGLRMSEIRGLDYYSIHKDELFIDKALVDVNGIPTLKHFTKTDASTRKVKIPAYIMELIKNTDGYQNPAPKGEFKPIVPMTHNQIYEPYKRALHKIGIDIRFHDLRKVFASVRLQVLGQSIKTVQAVGGWKDEKTLMKIYSQNFKTVRENSDKQMDKYMLKQMETHTKTHTKARKPHG